jgi:hypothetical protein
VFPAQLGETSTLILLAVEVPVTLAIIVVGVVAIMVVRRLHGADLISTLELVGRTLVGLLPGRKPRFAPRNTRSGSSDGGDEGR